MRQKREFNDTEPHNIELRNSFIITCSLRPVIKNDCKQNQTFQFYPLHYVPQHRFQDYEQNEGIIHHTDSSTVYSMYVRKHLDLLVIVPACNAQASFAFYQHHKQGQINSSPAEGLSQDQSYRISTTISLLLQMDQTYKDNKKTSKCAALAHLGLLKHLSGTRHKHEPIQ